jgi:hypothetical protein
MVLDDPAREEAAIVAVPPLGVEPVADGAGD